MGLWQRFQNWRRKPAQRSYDGARIGRLVADWLASDTDASTEVRGGLKTLRSRSRELERDNDYVRRYFQLLEKNVVGPHGFRLQMAAMDTPEQPDTFANDTIEEAWREWGRYGVPTVDGQKSWIDCQNLWLRGIARDGESIVRLVKGWRGNPFGFALQFLEPDQLDIELDSSMQRNGRRIKMGVELNEWQRPTRYWLLTSHPGAQDTTFLGKNYQPRPAAEILHSFREERQGQIRGVPWTAASMTRLNHLRRYEEAEVIAARACASKFATVENLTDWPGDGRDDDANKLFDFDPGSVFQLKRGWGLNLHDPTHPNKEFGGFVKAELRGVASGWGIGYNKLANDLEGVNFSSMRGAEIDERDSYMVLQTFEIEHFVRPVFRAWLEAFLTSGLTTLPLSKMDKFLSDTWQPKRWPWVNPLQDAKAHEIAVDRLWQSDQSVASTYGADIEDNIRDRGRLQRLLAAQAPAETDEPTE